MPRGLSVRVQPLTGAELDEWWSTRRARNPFSSWPWLSTLAETGGLGAEMRVLTVYRGCEVLGALPVEVARGPRRMRTLRMPGHGWLAADHLDVVADTAHEQMVANAIVDYLAGDAAFDVLDLDGVAGEGALAQALGRLRPPRFFPVPAEQAVAPFVDLGGNGHPVYRNNLRQQVGRGLRRAERSGGRFEILTQPAAVEAALNRLMHLHNRRFGRTTEVFATEPRCCFHRLAARRLAAAGTARIYRLSAGDDDAALLYALVSATAIYYYAMGFNPDAGLSPGRTILGLAIESAKDEGFSEFDLLRGDHVFKQRFATGVRDETHVRLLRLSARSGPELGRLLPGWAGRRLRGRVGRHREPVA